MLGSILQKLFIALISGFAEFFAVPAMPHRLLFEVLTGTNQSDVTLSLAIHIGTLLAVTLACKKRMVYLLRADRQERNTRRRRNRHLDMNAVLEIRMLKVAVIPLLLGMFFWNRVGRLVTGVAALALALLLNGFIVFLPRILPRGNKDCRMMSPLDSLVMGLGGVLALIPGVSRVTAITTAGALRGTDPSQTLDYAMLLSAPVLIVLICFDIYSLLAASVALTGLMILTMLLAAALACGGGYAAIVFMRFMSMKSGFYTFCYYSWGMALFSFVLYLLI